MYFIVERRTVAGYFSLSMGVLRESFALVIVEVMDDDGFALHQSRKGESAQPRSALGSVK